MHMGMVMSNSVTPWTIAARFLRPWDFPDKNTRAGVGCLFLLQGLFLTQRLNLTSLTSLALAGRFFTTVSPGKPMLWYNLASSN